MRPGFDLHELNARIDELVAESEAVQLIFLGVTTARDTVELIRRLCESERWECHQVPWKEPEHGRSIPVGLRWQPSDRSYISWALGLAPFDPMPFTRRFVGAPFTVIAFRASPPTEFIESKQDKVTGQVAAHLAHMDDGLGGDEEARKKMTKITTARKAELLASDLRSTARAQVIFALPPWGADALKAVLKTLPAGESAEGAAAQEKGVV